MKELLGVSAEGHAAGAGLVLLVVLVESVTLVRLHTAAQCTDVSIDNLVHCNRKQSLCNEFRNYLLRCVPTDPNMTPSVRNMTPSVKWGRNQGDEQLRSRESCM
ncbi:hypothetical protein ATANTOWER_022717 [Ataeniobius toweri]|uniref:Uncharacterized protein n=1 Tax=Ataeniobius toweri TaxID=208326 RepID=A0ABU7AZ67_9TELE|nr:hypothetical protein [Ataeniobius toweri]